VLISVIVPTFNKAPFLRASLLALGYQTLARDRFEVVVVVDGSTDESLPFLEGFRPGYELRYVWRENGGLASARNHGAALARGTHFLFMDDDVILHPEHLAHLRRGLGARPRAVHAGSLSNVRAQAVPRLLEWFAEAPPAFPRLEPYCVPCPQYDAPKTLFAAGEAPAAWWGVFTGGNLCVERDGFESAGGFDDAFRGWGPEDADLCYRLFRRGARGAFDAESRLYHLDHARDAAATARSTLRTVKSHYRKHCGQPEVLEYLRFYNGMTSLEEFNNACADLYHLPRLAVAPFFSNLRQVTHHSFGWA
jgi:glycosyltransferase involved in cell wall biosynthesis